MAKQFQFNGATCTLRHNSGSLMVIEKPVAGQNKITHITPHRINPRAPKAGRNQFWVMLEHVRELADAGVLRPTMTSSTTDSGTTGITILCTIL